MGELWMRQYSYESLKTKLQRIHYAHECPAHLIEYKQNNYSLGLFKTRGKQLHFVKRETETENILVRVLATQSYCH